MGGKRLQYIIRMLGLIVLITVATINTLGYKAPKVLSYSIGAIAVIYVYLVFKNRYR